MTHEGERKSPVVIVAAGLALAASTAVAIFVLVGGGLFARPEPVPIPMPGISSVPAAAADGAVELEVVVGGAPGTVIEVVGDTTPIPLAPSLVASLVPRRVWSWSAHGLSMSHDREVHVSEHVEEGEPEIFVSAPGGAAARVLMAATAPSLPEAETLLAGLATRLGLERVGPAQRRVAGRSAAGTSYRQTTGAMSVEMFSFGVGSRGLIVMRMVPLATEDTAALDAALASISAEERAPEPVADLRVGDRTHPLLLGQPASVAAGASTIEVTLRRRARVLRRFSGISFEHDGALAVSDSSPGMGLRMLRLSMADEGGIQIVTAPDMPPEMISETLSATLPHDGPPVSVTRTFSGREVAGHRFELVLGTSTITSEIFAWETTPGRTLVVIVQYDLTARDQTLAALGPIAGSIRTL